MSEIKEIAIPGSHQFFYNFFKKDLGEHKPKEIRVLDLGAGHGAFSKRLYDLGYQVYACDLFPEIFQFSEIECKPADFTKRLPYEDQTFDAIVALEIMEHFPDHMPIYSECNRILKSNGKLMISTPNILSLKSRFLFFMTGFYYSFKPIDKANPEGLEHVASITLDQYEYLGYLNGFKTSNIGYDVTQSTSKIIFTIMMPFIKFYNWRAKIKAHNHNKKNLLFGRKLYVSYRKTN